MSTTIRTPNVPAPKPIGTPKLKPPKWPVPVRIDYDLQTLWLREAKAKGKSMDDMLEEILTAYFTDKPAIT
jgi:uncharacterized protein (DUF4415 family)